MIPCASSVVYQQAIQSCVTAAQSVPWSEVCRGRKGKLFTDPQTQLSVVEMPEGIYGPDGICHRNEPRSRVIDVIRIWEQKAAELKGMDSALDPTFEGSRYVAKDLCEKLTGRYVYLDICGSQQHGVQGAMLWEYEQDSVTHNRPHIALHDLMTSPANLSSSTPERVKGVGTTCIHYLEQYCKTSPEKYHAVHTCSLFGATSFYKTHGFQYWEEIEFSSMGAFMIRNREQFDPDYHPEADTTPTCSDDYK
jgi:hypothetical protein